jgi:hypothetical protein
MYSANVQEMYQGTLPFRRLRDFGRSDVAGWITWTGLARPGRFEASRKPGDSATSENPVGVCFERRFTAERTARDDLAICRSWMSGGVTERGQLQDNEPVLLYAVA